MPEELSDPNIATGGTNLNGGYSLDILKRDAPDMSPQARAWRDEIIGGIMVVLSRENVLAQQDAFVRDFLDNAERYGGRVLKLSKDAFNALSFGSDGGIYLRRSFFQSGAINVAPSTQSSVDISIDDGLFEDANYQVQLELRTLAGPEFNWCVGGKSPNSVTIHYATGPAGGSFTVNCQK